MNWHIVIGLFAGLLLGIAGAAGGPLGFMLALLLGLGGAAIGAQLSGDFDLVGKLRKRTQ